MVLTPDRKQKEDGRCHICLRKVTLTLEHVPPKRAFNECNALWERLVIPDNAAESARRIRIRGGFRVRTLCRACNSSLCSPYAKAYVRFVRHLVESPRLFGPSGNNRIVSVPCDTLMLAKEIATMILAIEPEAYAQHYTDLRRFVLDRSATFQPNFRVFAFLVPDDPSAGTVTRFHARVATYAPDYGFVGGEISWFPFGFVYATQIGRGYDLDGLTDVTRWFTTAGFAERKRDIVSLRCRVTGVESIQCAVGRERLRPQLDYV